MVADKDSASRERGPIAVAMSGGVDSSTVAALLLEQGVEVFGVTMRLKDRAESDDGSACGGSDAVERAGVIARHLGIAHHELDCSEAFEAQVLRPAWNDYSQGRTPSPCFPCNEGVKLGALLDWSGTLGASALATGHYARVSLKPDGGVHLLRGSDGSKEQSYFLAGLSQSQLQRVGFPLGELTKKEVRKLAASFGLPNANASESQDACFADGDVPFAEALRARFAEAGSAGDVVDAEGKVLGKHSGIHQFTIGQRRGLPINAGRRAWVRRIDGSSGEVEVTHDESDLATSGLLAHRVSWIAGEPPRGLECAVQVRYRQKAVPCRLELLADDAVRVSFLEPVRAVAPGQAAVFYCGDRALGRAWIDRPT